jgi:glutamine amidotransferase
MCRLFGFRSVIPSQVHRSLLAAENALGVQSNQHPDGWGVAYYVDGAPHLVKSASTALGDQLFHHLSGVVASESVLAHVRKATQGEKTVLNCHPFQHGRWVFAHNGDIPNFAEKRGALLEAVPQWLRRYVLGETDSEVVFLLFLGALAAHGPLARRHAAEDVAAALSATVRRVREICDEGAHRALLTLMVTDGEAMLAHQGGKELWWSTHKTRCSDRDHCRHLSPECEAPSTNGFVNHLIVSSEPLSGENVWSELAEDEIVGVDHRMRLVRTSAGRRLLAVS